MKKIIIYFFIINFTISIRCFSQTKVVTPQPVTRILFVLDCSLSMQDSWLGSVKINLAKQVLLNQVDSLQNLISISGGKANISIAVRLLGSQSPISESNCNDSRLLLTFSPPNISIVKPLMRFIHPTGITPIAFTLEKALYDFPVDNNSKNFIVLLTDGGESCSGDPCAVSAALQQSKAEIRPIIVGMGVSAEEAKTFDCMGTFYNSPDPATFTQQVHEVVSQLIHKQGIIINLLDSKSRPVVSDIPLSVYDRGSGKSEYEIYHTLNTHGMPDTITVHPYKIYKIKIHTVPPIVLDSIPAPAAGIKTISVEAIQGDLKVGLRNGSVNAFIQSKILCLVRQENSTDILNVQSLNSQFRYRTGYYDLEFLTLPRTKLDHVLIEENKITTAQVDAPGLLEIAHDHPDYGTIFTMTDGKLVSLYTLQTQSGNEVVDLQPGTYMLLFRPRNSTKSTDSQMQKLTIESGKTLSIQL
jgi:Ca-activated chloride channel homolog